MVLILRDVNAKVESLTPSTSRACSRKQEQKYQRKARLRISRRIQVIDKRHNIQHSG